MNEDRPIFGDVLLSCIRSHVANVVGKIVKMVCDYYETREEPDMDTDTAVNAIWPLVRDEADRILEKRDTNREAMRAGGQKSAAIRVFGKTLSMDNKQQVISSILQPDSDLISITSFVTGDASPIGRGGWTKALRRIGRAAYADLLVTFVSEILSGEDPNNRASAFQARLNKCTDRP